MTFEEGYTEEWPALRVVTIDVSIGRANTPAPMKLLAAILRSSSAEGRPVLKHHFDDVPGLTTSFSACEWSHGSGTEHSIANAYIDAITNAKHFVYIENQVSSTERHSVIPLR